MQFAINTLDGALFQLSSHTGHSNNESMVPTLGTNNKSSSWSAVCEGIYLNSKQLY